MRASGREWLTGLPGGTLIDLKHPLDSKIFTINIHHPPNHPTKTGCETWAHAQCLYGQDRAPRLSFCYRCHATLQSLAATLTTTDGNGKQLPPVHTGRSIKLRSRVIVCRGPRGLEEGVVTMFGEGNARVHFKVRILMPVMSRLSLCGRGDGHVFMLHRTGPIPRNDNDRITTTTTTTTTTTRPAAGRGRRRSG